jgi:Domain of unknown function (DUF4440)
MLVCIVTSNTFGQAASARATRAEQSGDTEAVQQVLAVDAARRLAMLHSDVRTLDSLLAEDATIFWGDGTADDKASTLALLRSGRLRYAQLDYENTQVRLYGETAVVTGRRASRSRAITKGGHTSSALLVYTYDKRAPGGSSRAKRPGWRLNFNDYVEDSDENSPVSIRLITRVRVERLRKHGPP